MGTTTRVSQELRRSPSGRQRSSGVGGLPDSLVPGGLNHQGAEPVSQHGTHFYNRFRRHDLDVPPKSRNPVESQRDPSHGHDAATPQQALGTVAGRPLAPCTPVHPGHGAERLTWSAGLPIRLQKKGRFIVRRIGAVPVDEDQLCPAVCLIPTVALVLFHGRLWNQSGKEI